MALFFTADTHFGDPSILRHRVGFARLDEHDATLMTRWNDTIGVDDDVWHLGDFAAGASPAQCRAIFAGLNGRKRLVQGNHGSNRVLDLPWIEVVSSVSITVEEEGRPPRRFFLAHYPHRSWPGVWRGSRHLFGHTHGTLPDNRQSCDVGVDAWAYRPAAVSDVLARQDATSNMPEELALRLPS